MPIPQNPQTVVLKNSYYPSGLTEAQIWDHYQAEKNTILKETINRDITLIILVDLNKPIIRRNMGGSTIRLTPQNYDSIITGRTLGVHSAMGRYEDFVIIDVDVADSDGFKWAIDATKNVYNYIMDKVPYIRKASIRYTGKKSFHIVCQLSRKNNIDSNKFLIANELSKSPLARVYTINEKKAQPGIPNLDLNRNCVNCNYITLGSLSLYGLKCMEVPFSKLQTFNPRFAKI